jgi:hypothetical protein
MIVLARARQTVWATGGRIAAGDPGFVAMGDFLDDFYAAAREERSALIAGEPPPGLDARWAAYLAATVEVLAARHDLTVPPWTQRPIYFLREPWFLWEGARMLALLDTPRPFARHGIFADSRLLLRT